MPAGDPFGADWADAGGVTPASTKGEGTTLAGGEALGSGAGALGAGLAANTGPGANSKKAGSAQKKINRLSARSRPNEATLAPSHSLRIPGPGLRCYLLYTPRLRCLSTSARRTGPLSRGRPSSSEREAVPGGNGPRS
jgi:hypothetical protein